MHSKTISSLVRNRLALFGLFLLLSPACLFAQKTSDTKPTQIKWEFDQTVKGVNFYHALAMCNGKKVVYLKFDNTTKHDVKVSWKEQFDTQLETKVMGVNGVKEMTIAPGVTMPSGCGDNNRSRKNAIITAFDVQPHYVAEIRVFEFVDIQVQESN